MERQQREQGEHPRAPLALRPSGDQADPGRDRLEADARDGEVAVAEQQAQTLAAERATVGVVVPDPALRIGRGGEHNRVRPQHATHLLDERTRVGDVLEDVLQDRSVERLVGERKPRLDIAADHIPAAVNGDRHSLA